MKGLFIPGITTEMFRNGCLESIEELITEGEIYDIDYQQPCEDCISRKATVERLCKVADFMNEKREGLGSPYIMAALFIQDNKDEFPSVTPKEKTGHWIRQTDDYHDYYECEHCGIAVGLDDIKNYCPNCGAKMEAENDS